MSDVFISHSSKDKEIADKVVKFFEDKGLSCWIAPRDIVPGTEWAAAISTAITASKVFLIIYTANSAESSQVSREVSLAETKLGVFVVPYKTDETPLKGSFEYYLTGSHFISANYAKHDYKLDELYNIVSGIVGKNIQNITNNTYIDHLHIGSAENFPESISEVVKVKAAEQAASMQNTQSSDNKTIQEKAASNSATDKSLSDKKSRLPLIIGLAAAAVVVIAVVLIVVLGSGKEDEGDGRDRLVNMPTSVETEPTGKEDEVTPTAEETTPAPSVADDTPTPTEQVSPTEIPTPAVPETKEIKNTTVNFLGASCKLDYSGEVNEFGQPNGEGTYIGSYTNSDGEIVNVIYTGQFENGVASGNGVSEETYANGSVRKYEGVFANNIWNGEAVSTYIYTDGDIASRVIEGVWENGILTGKGKQTYHYVNGDNAVYECEFENGKRNGEGKYIREYASGDIKKYTGHFKDDCWDGTGISTYTYKSGDIEKVVSEGAWVENKFDCEYGIMTTYYTDKTQKVSEGTYKDGKLVSGSITTYDADGNMTGLEHVGEVDIKEVLVEYIKNYGIYYESNGLYAIQKSYAEVSATINGTERTIQDTQVNIIYVDSEDVDNRLQFTITNDNLYMTVFVSYFMSTGEFTFSSAERSFDGILKAKIQGTLQDYLNGSDDKLTYETPERYSEQEYRENTALLVSILHWSLQETFKEMDNGVTLESLGLDYWK